MDERRLLALFSARELASSRMLVRCPFSRLIDELEARMSLAESEDKDLAKCMVLAWLA